MIDMNKERELFEEAYLSVGGKQRELELEDGEYTNSKSLLGWELWQIKAKAQAVPDSSYGVILTCEQLKDALEFGAPDLKIESNEFSDEQMGTELAIIYQEIGHSGEGFYSYYVECSDEGSIKLGESESGAEP